MSLSTNKTLVKSCVESVFNDHDLSALEKYLADTGKGRIQTIVTIDQYRTCFDGLSIVHFPYQYQP